MPPTPPADSGRFQALAHELGSRDRELAPLLARLREPLGALREHACAHVAAFVAAAREAGAPHLAELAVSPLGPDEKHVDCLQFAVQRGRWELVCVAKPRGAVTLVGPYRRGHPERPCEDHPLPSPTADEALAERLLELIRQASAR